MNTRQSSIISELPDNAVMRLTKIFWWDIFVMLRLRND
mgnify:FL=1